MKTNLKSGDLVICRDFSDSTIFRLTKLERDEYSQRFYWKAYIAFNNDFTPRSSGSSKRRRPVVLTSPEKLTPRLISSMIKRRRNEVEGYQKDIANLEKQMSNLSIISTSNRVNTRRSRLDLEIDPEVI